MKAVLVAVKWWLRTTQHVGSRMVDAVASQVVLAVLPCLRELGVQSVSIVHGLAADCAPSVVCFSSRVGVGSG
eukprot:6161652-Amphidinium_carterae.2